MLSQPRFRSSVSWSVVGLLAFALAAVLAGCGGEDEGAEPGERVARGEEVREVSLPPALPEPDVELASGDVEETPEVAEPEPPREVSYEESEAAYLAGDYEEAVELFASYVERKPGNPWGHYMLGLSAWKAGGHGAAEEAFVNALERDPRHVKSWLNLSRVLLDGGRPEEALEKVDSALAIDPESNDGLRLEGRAYHRLGRLEEAVDAYRQAILADDRDAWSMNNLGLILIEQGRFEEALPPLARAVELRDDVAVFENNLGIALERTGHLRAAESAYENALALDATYEKARVSLARVEGLEESPETEPVDLAELAAGFEEEIEGWREAVAHEGDVDDLEIGTVIVPVPDSLSPGDPRQGDGQEGSAEGRGERAASDTTAAGNGTGKGG